MQVIRLKPLVIDGFIHWSKCVKEEKMEEEDFLKLNDPDVIPFMKYGNKKKLVFLIGVVKKFVETSMQSMVICLLAKIL